MDLRIPVFHEPLPPKKRTGYFSLDLLLFFYRAVCNLAISKDFKPVVKMSPKLGTITLM